MPGFRSVSPSLLYLLTYYPLSLYVVGLLAVRHLYELCWTTDSASGFAPSYPQLTPALQGSSRGFERRADFAGCGVLLRKKMNNKIEKGLKIRH